MTYNTHKFDSSKEVVQLLSVHKKKKKETIWRSIRVLSQTLFILRTLQKMCFDSSDFNRNTFKIFFFIYTIYFNVANASELVFKSD